MGARSNKRDRKGHVDPFYDRRVRFRAALGAVGLWDAFAAMPRLAQEQLMQRKFADPVVEFDASVPEEDATAIRPAIEARLREAAVDATAGSLKVRDYYAILTLCRLLAEQPLNPRTPDEVRRFFAQALPVLQEVERTQHLPIARAMFEAVHAPVVGRSRLDGRLFTAPLEFRTTPAGKRQVRIVVRATDPQMRYVTLDGERRPMYRVTTASPHDHLQWLSWTAEQFGKSPGAPERPVYVQSHALRALQQRANLPAIAPYLHAWLCHAMEEAKVIDRIGDDLLVELRVDKYRFGYFVVSVLPDLIAVRTFLFLTMEGTPEARNLRRELNLSRRDVDWLGLDNLNAFTQTDLRNDQELRRMLKRCGCGHLFKMDEEHFSPEPKPFATEMRKYLRLAA
ncbi:MAG TPA: hypothetical protein VGN72_21540 [Tepidisphaeraceae bacterium]|jgi:hypothetical protein|nr:hypothetical protein [Tepidisphaeraceae bacterium]